MKEKIKPLLPYIIIIVIVLFIKAFIITPIKVNGESMYPTLEEGDIMILNKTAYYFNEPKRFDIVVVDMPNEYLIKRVIGLPGDNIVFKDDKLYINGTYYVEDYLDKDYIEEAKEKYNAKLFTEDFEITLDNDEIFVLGDNRLRSSDSRTLGTFKYSDIIGKKGIVIFPLKNMKFVE